MAAPAAAAAQPALRPTPVADIPGIVAAARTEFNTGRTKGLDWRMQQLRRIKALCEENKAAVRDAIYADLRRPEMECIVAELTLASAEADEAMKHLKSWSQPVKVETPAVGLPGSSYIRPDPLGVVGIIAPWNFPIQLVLCGLVSAVAAGNAVVIKPSELAPHCAVLLEALVARYLDTAAIRVVQGAVAETSKLLEQRFDHILYTGNGTVARIVMAAAARHLTPVTLELGGKSPTLVDRDADLDLAAQRIIVSKVLNAGQVCLAPDYVLAHRDIMDALLAKMGQVLTRFYGADRKASPDIARIINARHWARIKGLLDSSGGTIVHGGASEEASLYIEPTVIREPKLAAPIMQEEIFGPLLPVLPVASMEEAIAFVNARDKPLALYVFSGSSATAEQVLRSTSSGGAVVNDCIMHVTIPTLPFGGVGESGMGAYHGKWGFDTFSHKKAVFYQPTWIDMGKLRYPPYSAAQLARIETLIKVAPPLPKITLTGMALLGLSAAVVALAVKLAQVTGHL